METLVPQNVPEKDLSIPRWMLYLARWIAPRHDWNIILGDLLALQCHSIREFAWCAGEVIKGVIQARMGACFNIWLVAAEALSMYVALALPDGHTPLVPLAVLLTFLLILWRFRDAYSYPHGDSTPQMFLDFVMGAALVVGLELFLNFYMPRLALSLPKTAIAVAAVLWESCMRMLARREDHPDPKFQNIKQKVGAIWQMTILWAVACNALQVSNVIAVPGSHLRDRTLTRLMGLSMIAMIRLKKANFVSVWKHVLPSFLNPGLPELQKALDTLWFRDKLSRFRSDLLAEASYFIMLGFPIAQATWQWASPHSAPAQTNWFQLAINLGGWFGMMVWWIHIKGLHEKLAVEIRKEIDRRKAEAVV